MNRSIFLSARSFFAGTALSRISGLFRDIAMAASFGTSPEIAAFAVAYRLANLFRRILGEGNLQAGFVPHFVALKEEGGRFYRDVTVSLAFILLGTVLLLEALFFVCRRFVSPDWIEIIDLSMWMIPGLFFICLYGLNSALLQCRKKYFLPAAAPVAFNLIWILAVLFFPGVHSLAFAVTFAFAAQWFMTLFEGFKLLPFKEWLKPRIFSPDFRALLKPLSLGIVGISAVQLNTALDAIFARLADSEGPAFLWYAIRIQQLPLSLFGVALSGAILPPLSKTEDPLERQTLLRSALPLTSALLLLCTFGIFALGEPGIYLLYGHGHFSTADVAATCRCLWGYGPGLLPSVFVLLFAARSYAEKNYRAPMFASLFSVALNIFLNALFIFVFGWGAVSIAIATSLSAFGNMLLLSKGVFTRAFGILFAKMAFACSFSTLLTLALTPSSFPRDVLTQLIYFLSLSAVYLAGVMILGWFLGLKEVLKKGYA